VSAATSFLGLSVVWGLGMGGENEFVAEQAAKKGGRGRTDKKGFVAEQGHEHAPGVGSDSGDAPSDPHQILLDAVYHTNPALGRAGALPGWARQDVRVHANDARKEVHFHVDAEKLKAAIPVAEFVSVYHSALRLTPRTFVDWKRKTLAAVVPVVEADGEVEVVLAVAQFPGDGLSLGDVFDNLRKVAQSDPPGGE
jgi:hypothetical protein